MKSFSLYTPTRLFFGADQAAAFAASAAQLGRHAFLVTGGGTVERLGYVTEVANALRVAGVRTTLFTGIEPNPESATINRAAAQLKTVGADFVIALGGGSVMDATKAIAALAHASEPDIWPFVLGEARAFQLSGALPIAAIPTTAATASEVTPFAVVSNRTAKGKSVLAFEFLKPRVSWLNPAYTITLSARTTQDGAADILSHVFENYLLGGDGSPLADRHTEGVIHTVIETLPRLLVDPSNVMLRGHLLWASTLALNDYQRAGRNETQFVLHSMEHALSGFYPELAHGRGLATLYPAYFRWLLAHDRARSRLAQLGERIFGLDPAKADAAEGFIVRFEAWLADNGLFQSLGDLGIAEKDFEAVAAYAVKTYGDGQQLEALGALFAGEIAKIFRATSRQAKVAAA